MSRLADRTDQALLNRLQDGLPLAREPYAVVAERIGTNVDDVLERIERLRREGVIRQISAIFDTRSLGYQSTLVAAQVPDECLERAVQVINGHPGVSHNYYREHAFNIWFTLGVPPDSRLGLERTLDILRERAGATSIRVMPTLKVFKIGMKLDVRSVASEADENDDGGSPFGTEVYDESRRPTEPLSPEDTALVRELQWDMPTTARPYDGCAERLGMPVDAVLAGAARLHEQGHLRRVAAVLHHREAGFRANGMGVWVVPEARIDEVGRAMAGFREVSHCYLRPTYPDWPYNVFSMVHAADQAGCQAVLDRIAEATGIAQRDVLYSTKQYKKIRLRYFTDETSAWEKEATR